MPATYDPIATRTLSTNSTQILFSSIPGTYTDLRLVLQCITTSNSNNLLLRYNGNTSSIYSQTFFRANSTNVVTSSNLGSSGLFLNAGATDNTIPMLYTVDVFSYASTSINKSCLQETYQNTNTGGNLSRFVGLWRSTAAITSLQIDNITASFTAGATATLYGILRA